MMPDAPGAGDPLVIEGTYRKYRLEDGLKETAAIERMVADGLATPEVIQEALWHAGLTDAWPVGWQQDEYPKLAKWMTYDDVVARFKLVVETDSVNQRILPLLAAQSHFAPILKEACYAVHVIPISPKFSSGKSRCAEGVTILGGGEWFDSATVAGLKLVRDKGPTFIGIDEGDEAERDQPGIKAYLLGAFRWDARNLKAEKNEKTGKFEAIMPAFGGPVAVTFRKEPWSMLKSRAHVVEMELSRNIDLSDYGAIMKSVLGPAAGWLRLKAESALAEKDPLWAKRRIGEKDFRDRLTRMTEAGTVPRQRDVARSVLLLAELIGLDLDSVEKEWAAIVASTDFESENANIIEAIEADPFYARAIGTGDVVPTEPLRLRVEKELHSAREYVDVSRRRFNAVLKEMGYKERTAMWRRDQTSGRDVMVIVPSLLHKPGLGGIAASTTSATSTDTDEKGQKGQKGQTGEESLGGERLVEAAPPSNGVVEVVRNVLRELGKEFEDTTLTARLEMLELADEDVREILAALRFRGELQEVRPGTWSYKEASS